MTNPNNYNANNIVIAMTNPNNYNANITMPFRYVSNTETYRKCISHGFWDVCTSLDTWNGFEAAIRLLHGRVGDSTTLVNSLRPQMSELVEDAVASWCGDIVGLFWLIRNELQKLMNNQTAFCWWTDMLVVLYLFQSAKTIQINSSKLIT